jgi:hypothetical protein
MNWVYGSPCLTDAKRVAIIGPKQFAIGGKNRIWNINKPRPLEQHHHTPTNKPKVLDRGKSYITKK